MADNVTFLGKFADDFDSSLKQAETILDDYVESSGYSTGSMILASTTIAFMRFGQSYADLLRIGNGLFHGGMKGAGMDGLRMLSLLGLGGAVVSRVSRILVVTQKAGTFTCTWISTANALHRTGQRFFVSIEELAESAGVDLDAIASAGGTTVQQVRRLIEALKKMNVAVDELTPNFKYVDAVSEVLKSRPNGVLVFVIEYGEESNRVGHQLFATMTSSGLTITDTDGKIFQGAKALSEVYKNASVHPGAMFFMKNAALISNAETARTAGGIGSVALELLPFKMKENVSQTSSYRR